MATWHGMINNSKLTIRKHREINLSTPETEKCRWRWHQGSTKRKGHMETQDVIIMWQEDARKRDSLSVPTCGTQAFEQEGKGMGLQMLECTTSILGFAPNTKLRSPFNSLHFAAPQAYMAWPLLNLQSKVWKSNDLEGLSAKFTTPHYLRPQYAK